MFCSRAGLYLSRVSAKPLRVYERRPDSLELELDLGAADEVTEQLVLESGPIGRPDTVLRVEVLRKELWVQPA